MRHVTENRCSTSRISIEHCSVMHTSVKAACRDSLNLVMMQHHRVLTRRNMTVNETILCCMMIKYPIQYPESDVKISVEPISFCHLTPSCISGIWALSWWPTRCRSGSLHLVYRSAADTASLKCVGATRSRLKARLREPAFASNPRTLVRKHESMFYVARVDSRLSTLCGDLQNCSLIGRSKALQYSCATGLLLHIFGNAHK